MHNGDKVGLSDASTLARSQNKTVVNPYATGVVFLHLARKFATRFLYSTCLDKLHKLGKGFDAPKIKPKIDLNGTRVAVHQQLLFSLLCLNRSLQIYQIYHLTVYEVTTEERKEIGKIEGVFNIMQLLTIILQYETVYCAAYRPLI